MRPSFEGTEDVGDDDDDIAVESKKTAEPIEKKTEKRPVDEAKQKAAIERLKQKAASVPTGSSLLQQVQEGVKLKKTERQEKTSPSTSKIEEQLKKNIERSRPKKP